jgi:DNA-binding FadR family transcriptional regulator
MKLKEIVAPSMKTLFVKEIEHMILSGQLAIGEKLPTEREMAEQMKVSRTTTNSGLQELANKGFIEIIPRQGTFVADYKRGGTLDTLVAIIEFNGRLDRKTFQSLMDFRFLIEGTVAFLAANNRTDEDLLRLESCYRQMCECDSAVEAAELKCDFLHALTCASGNVIYPLIVTIFKEINVHFHQIICRHAGVRAIHAGLDELIEAIRARDAKLAREIAEATVTVRIGSLKEKYFEI